MFRMLAVLVVSVLMLPVTGWAQPTTDRSEVDLNLIVHGGVVLDAPGNACTLNMPAGVSPRLNVESAQAGDTQSVDLDQGTWVSVDDTPMRTRGCLFHIPLTIDGSDTYSFAMGRRPLTEVPGQAMLEAGGTFYLTARYDYRDGAFETKVLASEDRAASPQNETEVDTQRDSLNVTVILFVYADLMIDDGDTCRIDVPNKVANVTAHAESVGYRSKESLRDGRPVTSGESPLGADGCLFTVIMRLREADSYQFSTGTTLLADIPMGVIRSSETILLAVDASGNRTPAGNGIVTPAPTPTPTLPPTPVPSPTPIPTEPAGMQGDGTYLIRGYFVLRSDSVVNTTFSCNGTGGFSDVGDGAQIIVRDGNNNVLGTGRLKTDTELSGNFGCSYTFTASVPKTDFYQIEFSHRGPLVYTFDEMEATDWEIYLTLGD